MTNKDEICARFLTVHKYYSQRRYEECIVPHIRLNGIWLKDAGFEVGDKVIVLVSDKCLQITVNDNHNNL